jgi:hypothetical protein
LDGGSDCGNSNRQSCETSRGSMKPSKTSSTRIKKSQVRAGRNNGQRLQSPYNSKSMKNKFSSLKDKNSVVMKSLDGDNCNRCTELISMLKTTRFIGR